MEIAIGGRFRESRLRLSGVGICAMRLARLRIQFRWLCELFSSLRHGIGGNKIEYLRCLVQDDLDAGYASNERERMSISKDILFVRMRRRKSTNGTVTTGSKG